MQLLSMSVIRHLKLHDMIRDTVEKIAELAHTDKTDFTSADMINMDEVESLVKIAIDSKKILPVQYILCGLFRWQQIKC